MKKLLITGFDPFGGATVNPSREAVMALPDTLGDWALTKLEVPTVFGLAARRVLDTAAVLEPDAIICVGQAGGRKAVTPEVVAINLREASIPDNHGHQPQNTPVVEDGPAAYFSTLPVREIVAAIGARGIPSALSYSAGAFVCNDLLYTLLHHYHGTEVQVGFIHIPYLPEQAGEGIPSLPLESIVEALTAAIAAVPTATVPTL